MAGSNGFIRASFPEIDTSTAMIGLDRRLTEIPYGTWSCPGRSVGRGIEL